MGAFAEVGAVVYGVSRDSVASHKKFAEKNDLNMPLLADVDGAMCRAFDVLKEKSMFGKTSLGIERTTYVVGPDGTIAAVFPKVRVEGHAAAVLAVVRELAGRQ